MTIVLLVTVACYCLSLTFLTLILAVFWSINGFIKFKEEHDIEGDILKAFLAAQFC